MSKVWIVTISQYYEWHINSVHETKESARKFIKDEKEKFKNMKVKPNFGDEPEYDIEEWELMPT